jgi:hypothetical protein
MYLKIIGKKFARNINTRYFPEKKFSFGVFVLAIFYTEKVPFYTFLFISQHLKFFFS